MQIVIDIDEELRVEITRVGLLRLSDEKIYIVDKAIQSGKPLPKGHGRLIDADRARDILLHKHRIDFKEYPKVGFNYRVGLEQGIELMEKSPTVLDADE